MVKNVEKKVCLLGDWGVGKTSLIRRFVENAYDDRYLATLGVKVSKKEMIIKNFLKKPFLKVNLTLLIWDLVGQKGFHNVQVTAYKGTSAAFIVCDLSRPHTIDNMEWWISHLFQEAKNVPLIFLANKLDLTDDDVPLELNRKLDGLKGKYKAHFFATSAKTGTNVGEAFERIGQVVTEKFF
ncbi:MAG: GTP-binding protein [Thermoplasmata archaeon]|nr:MAG: GTP-binding protein [Thermoplasmata archaeon]